MIIKSLRVERFRGILDATLPCEPLTVLVGANGCGKSTFLRALELFYEPSPRIMSDDFYDRDTSQPISISVTFTELDDAAKNLFRRYLFNDELTVTRVLNLVDGKLQAKYHGSLRQNPDFHEVRSAEGARELRKRYDDLRQSSAYSELPAVTSREKALEALRHWEEEHPDRCVRTLDDGSFFGFTEVAQGYLGRFTRFLLIPAVRDAQQDGTEGRGSPITALMDLVVRSALARRAELVEFKQEVENRYREIMNPEGMPELNALEQRLRSSLQTFVPGSGLSVVWQPSANFSLPMPQADVKLIEHDYASPVANAGHGLQRAFVLSILQNLALAEIQSSATSSEAENAPPLPSLVLAIEEPELYQHPNRQRHLAKVLRDLAEGSIPGAVRKTQILYATHSPFFVSIDSFHQVRVLRKVCAAEGKPKVTQVVHFSGDSAAEELHRAEDDPKPPGYTWHTLQARLQAVMTTEMAEGFFADVAVLVEGEEDRAALLAAAARKGYHLEADGIAIIPCDGKTNLDKPLVIFRGFGIATYVIWDGDAGTNGAEPVHNRRLLRLLGEPVVDWPQTTVRATFACFHKTLHDEIKDALDGDCYDTLMKECEQKFAIPKRKHAIKHPAVVRRLLDLAAEHGKPVQILEEIVDAIMRRKQA